MVSVRFVFLHFRIRRYAVCGCLKDKRTVKEKPSMFRLHLILVLCVLMFTQSACTLASASAPTPQPTATSLRVAAATAVPTLARRVESRDRGSVQSPNCYTNRHHTRPRLDRLHARPRHAHQHVVSAQVDYTAKTIQARHRVEYVNRTGETLNDFVLNIEPNRWLEAFAVGGRAANDRHRGYTTGL